MTLTRHQLIKIILKFNTTQNQSNKSDNKILSQRNSNKCLSQFPEEEPKEAREEAESHQLDVRTHGPSPRHHTCHHSSLNQTNRKKSLKQLNRIPIQPINCLLSPWHSHRAKTRDMLTRCSLNLQVTTLMILFQYCHLYQEVQPRIN